MNIVICSPILENIDEHSFIGKTFFLLAEQHSEHKFIIITLQKSTEKSFHSNIELIFVKPLPKNAFLKKIWWDIKLPGILKKVKADLFISLNDCSLTASIPQFIMIQNLQKLSKPHLKKAQLLIVPNNPVKKHLIEKFEIREERIAVIYPSADKMYEPINETEKDAIKNKYTEGKEFFLFNSIFSFQKDLIALLKSFSHFKKRQQSNFKLLISAPLNSFFEKSLEGYKYRNDVGFIDIKDNHEKALIVASAYTIVLPFNADEDMTASLNAARSGIPVVAVKDSIINEVFGDAALYSESEVTKDIGEKMMQVYTDENYRTRLIEKGKQVAGEYTTEKAAGHLWQSIIKVLE